VWGSDDGGICWFLLTADSDGAATSGYRGASLVVATLGGVEFRFIRFLARITPEIVEPAL